MTGSSKVNDTTLVTNSTYILTHYQTEKIYRSCQWVIVDGQPLNGTAVLLVISIERYTDWPSLFFGFFAENVGLPQFTTFKIVERDIANFTILPCGGSCPCSQCKDSCGLE